MFNKNKSDIMDYEKILQIIIKSAQKRKTVEIYYPKTNNSPEGWREIEPYNISTDIGDEAEILDHDKEIISPGHILNAYTLGSRNNDYHSFILGKIKKARETVRSFTYNKLPVNF